MGSSLDPAAAEQAPAIARRQRRRVLDESREPWWAWLAVFLLILVISASRDVGADARSWALALTAGLLLAWTYLPKLSPRIATMIGQGLRPHSRLLPLRTRVVMLGASLVGAALAIYVGGLAAGYLDRIGAPARAIRMPSPVR